MTQGDVAVLGLGPMGAALAALFVNQGLATKVWNRTSEKAAPLVAAGAELAADPAAAVSDVPLAMVCLDRYNHVREVLDQANLTGCTVVNVTWGTPDEARTMSRWVQERGGLYLDGNIYVYPEGLGPDFECLSYAGERSVFDAHADVLSTLALPKYDGADPALPNILGSAGGIAHHIEVGAFYEAAAYAAHYGVSPATFLEFHERLGGPLTSHARHVAVDHLEKGDFATDQAALRTHFDSMLVNRADMQRIGQPAPMLGAFVDLLATVADEKGHLALAAACQDFRRPQG
ncbi:NAD(P)-binding domain-containing protein [Marmoricola sp. URHB0036]|uniref:NAD(P)-binding domain-containing protein n=1 Tax=Marmoricola sp. URHB0036 TaxID=1298863 RepID=UPI00040E5A00|nr:NAD(P)-binding domain-containing protein [Marmoricola sp. URHB0036]